MPEQEVAMSPTEVEEFLGDRETGVLALAAADEPYAIPISYGFDARDSSIYLRLVSTPDSEKAAFLDHTSPARLVVYEATEEGYESVIATGILEEIDRDDLSVDQIEQYGQSQRPLFEMWGRSESALDIGLYHFDPDELSGRRVVLRE